MDYIPLNQEGQGYNRICPLARFSQDGEAWLEQHLKNSSGQGCPDIYEVGRARIFAEAKIFLAGENRAVLREASLGSLLMDRVPRQAILTLPDGV